MNIKKVFENHRIEKKEYIDFLLKAQTEVAIKSIKEDIQYVEESISAWEEDIETWTMVENKLEFILYLMNKNSKEWDLVYKNS